MFCKHCGKEIADDAKFCSSCGGYLTETPTHAFVEAPKKKKKKKHPILGAIILVFGLFCVVGAIGISNDPVKVSSSTPSTEAAEPIATTVPAAFTVGDTLEMNGILITFEDLYESNGTQFLSPADGNVFVTCEFTIENQSNADLAVSSLMSFKGYFDDYAANISIGAMMADESKNQLDGTIAPGKKISGVVGYEVPKDWQSLEVHFAPSIASTKSFVFNYSK